MIKKLASAFIKETQKNQIIATAKHFPGHGYVIGDSHKNSVYLYGKLKELEVFKQMISDSVLSIMIGHIIIRDNKEYSTNGIPASLSKNIVTGLLKKKLGFQGLIVTDALNMKAVSKIDNVVLKAIYAGNDLILMPNNMEMNYYLVLNKYKTDKTIKLLVNNSVKKIIRMKICLDLFNNFAQKDSWKNTTQKNVLHSEYLLKGNISKYPVEMKLLFNANKISGSYIYLNNKVKLRIQGYKNKQGYIHLKEYDNANNNTGIFHGKFQNSIFTGKWTKIKNRNQLKFRLILQQAY